MSTLDDPNVIDQGAQSAIQSSAPPYVPITSSTAIDPYTGLPNNVGQISTEMQYNTIYNPQYWSPNQQLTYTPITNDPSQELTYDPISGMYFDPAQATAYGVIGPGQTNPYTYNASTAGAAQGTVDPMSMVQNQMDDILHSGDTDGDGVPDWAAPAVTAANQKMNALGLGASTMTGNATTTAILNAAMPMAMANAQVVAQLNTQNLSNQQQSMLSNAAWENAAKQFNAQSQQQNAQFFSTLTAQIAAQNADRMTAVSQFNAGQTNSVNQFLANLNSQRDEFNASNQLLINQSNVQWRRAINVSNTAGINSVNMANAQNMFNMSMTSQNNLWQQSRDEASWALTAGENSKNRLLSLVNSALNRQTSLQILASTLNANMFSQLGSFATNLLGGSFGSSLTNSLFGNNDSSSADFGTSEDITNIDNAFGVTAGVS